MSDASGFGGHWLDRLPVPFDFEPGQWLVDFDLVLAAAARGHRAAADAG